MFIVGFVDPFMNIVYLILINLWNVHNVYIWTYHIFWFYKHSQYQTYVWSVLNEKPIPVAITPCLLFSQIVFHNIID